MILLVIGMGSVLLSDVDAASLLRKSTRREGGVLCSPHALPAFLTYCRTCKEREMQRKKDKTWIRGKQRG